MLIQTPPLYRVTELCLHILGRGRSCVPLFTLHILPTTAGPQIADARIRPAGQVARELVVELFAVGMQGVGWTVEFSTDLQQWQPCDDQFPYGWVDGVSNWADTFRARVGSAPGGVSRFYRLNGTR